MQRICIPDQVVIPEVILIVSKNEPVNFCKTSFACFQLCKFVLRKPVDIDIFEEKEKEKGKEKKRKPKKSFIESVVLKIFSDYNQNENLKR